MSSSSIAPTHLSVFACAPPTGDPIARMPLYAEITVSAPAPVVLPPGDID